MRHLALSAKSAANAVEAAGLCGALDLESDVGVEGFADFARRRLPVAGILLTSQTLRSICVGVVDVEVVKLAGGAVAAEFARFDRRRTGPPRVEKVLQLGLDAPVRISFSMQSAPEALDGRRAR